MFNILCLLEEPKNLPANILFPPLMIYRAAKRRPVPATEVVLRINPNFSIDLVSKIEKIKPKE